MRSGRKYEFMNDVKHFLCGLPFLEDRFRDLLFALPLVRDKFCPLPFAFSLLPFTLCLLATSCTPSEQPVGDTLFTTMPASETGIDFANNLEYNKAFNIYTYRNFYNGGGVAIGDLNNDSLPDVYFTANMGKNHLYLNKGNFKFEDITEKAGIGGTKAWSTGVVMADVNADGFLDIYVCNSGDIDGDNKQNELFINNGDLTFTEKAAEYGLDDKGYSTHAAFFDYDKDGDLDMYLLNNSYQAIGSFNLRKNIRGVRDPVGGHKLFRNDGGKFTDVSEAAGIYGSVIAFGLGVTVGDVDRDGWLDIYVSNDFFERDYLYINQKNGTFKEVLETQIRSISGASMGADMADFNNDGYPEIFVTEMLPEPNDRLKTATTFENWDRYQYNVKNGYYHQFTRNMFHLNNADGTFSEIGRLAGVEATDWSWGALIVDLDNNGKKDVFVANGIYQDLTDQDFLNFIANEEVMRSVISKEGVDYKKLIDYIPSRAVPNYAFSREGGENDFRFTNRAKDWGLDAPSFSNGSAYADLDNDGDLDLVVNNVNMPAFVYRNETRTKAPDHHYLGVRLKGGDKNTFAVGAKASIFHQGQQYYLEQIPTRGFQSSVENRLLFGLGKIEVADTLLVEWPNGKFTLRTKVPTNQLITLSQDEATELPHPQLNTPATIFTTVAPPFEYRHEENIFVDFDRDRLLYHMLSAEGPKVAKGDVNGDGLEDLYIGGAKDHPGSLFVQKPGGRFQATNQALFENDKLSEDAGALFFDADGDGDQDLYVASGGNEFVAGHSALADRLYLNNGRGNFSKSPQFLPTPKAESTACVAAADYDQDGDLDLFVGVRLRPELYGVPCNGYILQNDGKGKFTNVTPSIAPGLKEVGMITTALWADVDGDKDPDLLLAGDWMPVRVFENQNSNFTETTEAAGLLKTDGWWNTLVAADVDGDGDVDLIGGNHGWNSRLRATPERPVSMHVNDYDQNGTVEQIICSYNGDKAYPLALRHDLVAQLPALKKKYLQYANYKDQTLADIFTPEQLKNCVVKEVYHLATTLFVNNGKGVFEMVALPIEAQFSPVCAILADDFNDDGHTDLLLGGNFFRAKPEMGRYDASYGTLLLGDGKNGFRAAPSSVSGLKIGGEIRDLVGLKAGKEKLIFVARNDDEAVFLKRKG